MTTLVPVESGTPVKSCTHYDLSGTEMCEERAVVAIIARESRIGITTEQDLCDDHPVGREVDALLGRFPYVDEITIRRLP